MLHWAFLVLIEEKHSCSEKYTCSILLLFALKAHFCQICLGGLSKHFCHCKPSLMHSLMHTICKLNANFHHLETSKRPDCDKAQCKMCFRSTKNSTIFTSWELSPPPPKKNNKTLLLQRQAKIMGGLSKYFHHKKYQMLPQNNFFQVSKYFSRFLLKKPPVFPAFPGLPWFFQVFQVKWEPCYLSPHDTILVDSFVLRAECSSHLASQWNENKTTSPSKKRDWRLTLQMLYPTEQPWRTGKWPNIPSHRTSREICPRGWGSPCSLFRPSFDTFAMNAQFWQRPCQLNQEPWGKEPRKFRGERSRLKTNWRN